MPMCLTRFGEIYNIQYRRDRYIEMIIISRPAGQAAYFTCKRPGGFHEPSPGGRIEGASVFGQ
jgi:hypothetical protein